MDLIFLDIVLFGILFIFAFGTYFLWVRHHEWDLESYSAFNKDSFKPKNLLYTLGIQVIIVGLLLKFLAVIGNSMILLGLGNGPLSYLTLLFSDVFGISKRYAHLLKIGVVGLLAYHASFYLRYQFLKKVSVKSLARSIIE